MGSDVEGTVLPDQEVPMLEPEVVRHVRELRERGWGSRRIAQELEISRNTVRRYLRGGARAEVQERPRARLIGPALRAEALRLFDGEAQGNAVVVRDLLELRGISVTARTVQRLLRARRQQLRAEQVATVRFESAPGQQMQVDFGQKRVVIAGAEVVVHVLTAVLSYSRRIFVRAFLSERQEDWREGIAAAFLHFGGVPRTVLGDNARALVVDRDRRARTVTFHPAYVAFSKDWGFSPRACAPYRARTKGKTESGVKYVKRNALAGRAFDSFASLQAHLAGWMLLADQREHGTTHQAPLVRFERDERAALQPLPFRALPTRDRRLKRRVAHDALVDVDTVRYSVPHGLVREHVDVAVGEQEVRIYFGSELVAVHKRAWEPHTQVFDIRHFAGLWRSAEEPPEPSGQLASLGRGLEEYAAVIPFSRVDHE